MKLPPIRALCLLAWLCCGHAVFADDLDTIVDTKTTPEQRGEAYERLTHADFSDISIKLAKVITAIEDRSPIKVMIGVIPTPVKPPWLETRFSQDLQIRQTLYKLWDFHMYAAMKKPHYTALLVSILENPDYGELRSDPIFKIEDCLKSPAGMSNPAELSKPELLKHLDTFARNAKNPVNLRHLAAALLFKQADPNLSLDVVIEIIDAEPDPPQRYMDFYYCLDSDNFKSLTKPNQNRCIRKAFEWLEKMDDGRSGQGSLLAGLIGYLLDIKPGPGGDGPFAPDLRLPKYRNTKGGFNTEIAQDVVNNARAWWAKHHNEYDDNGVKPQ